MKPSEIQRVATTRVSVSDAELPGLLGLPSDQIPFCVDVERDPGNSQWVITVKAEVRSA